MSRKTGIIVLFIGSEILGIAVGEWYYRFFLKTVPPLALSSFNAGAAHLGFIGYGALTGLVFFVWSLVIIFMQGLASKVGASSKDKKKPTP